MTRPSTDRTERRYTKGTVELRSAPGTEQRVFHGYALKFDRLSQNLGGFVERVAGRSTIAKTLADGGDVVARMHHKDEYLLGRVSSGTLRLSPDDTGLNYDVDSPGTSYARDLEALAGRGDIKHSSFAFRTIDDDWGLTDNGFPVRTLVEVQLVDVAPVVNPAYLDTSSSVRSLASRLDAAPDEVAELLRAGRLADVLKRPATVVDLGGEAFVPKTAVRRFNPRQPRDGDGKWADGPGGGGNPLSALIGDDEDDEPVFKAATTVRAGTGKVGIAPREDGGADLGLRYSDDPDVAVVALSAEDIGDLGVHLDWAADALKEQRKKADEWDRERESSPEFQAKQKRRAELTAQMKAELAPLPGRGTPERVAVQKKYDAQIDAETGEREFNPYEDGTPLPESVATFGNLHFAAVLSDDEQRIVLSDKRVTADTGDDAGIIMTPRQAKTLVAKLQAATGGERSFPTSAETRPDALHLAAAARARRLALLARRIPL